MARSFTASSSQYLSLGTASGLNITGNLSVSFWTKTTATTNQNILCCYQGSPSYPGWGLGLNNGTGSGKLAYYANAIGWKGSTGTVNGGSWTHAGITINGTGAGAGTFYIDGAASGTWTHTAPSSYTGNKNIGYDNGAGVGSTGYMSGELAEMAVWNVALSAAEMASLGKGYSPDQIRPGSLVAYWPLIGRLSPEIEPWSGYNGTLTNAPTQSAHPRVIYSESRKKIFVPVTTPATQITELWPTGATGKLHSFSAKDAAATGSLLPLLNHYMMG